jgi:uncharacterized protein (TIGR04442 family)
MINKFIISGDVKGLYEYTAVYCGRNISRETYFFEQRFRDNSSQLKFFSKGNLLVLSERGIEHSGCGGTFCEYMPGMRIPHDDLVKPNVLNRLVIYGAHIPEGRNTLVFTNSTDGFVEYGDIFEKGHAVCNWFFFVSSKMTSPMIEKQRWILKYAGRFIKSTPLIASLKADSHIALADALMNKLPEDEVHLFLLKLVNTEHERYARTLRNIIKTDPTLSSSAVGRERSVHGKVISEKIMSKLRLDTVYKYRNNRKIIDTYKMLLSETSKLDGINQETQNYISRYRDLLLKKGVPKELYRNVEELFNVNIQKAPCSNYISEFRIILSNLLLRECSSRGEMLEQDFKTLLRAKHKAFLENNKTFEQILIDMGKRLDEIKDVNFKIKQIDFFSKIITYFDIYDSCSATMTRCALEEDLEMDEVMIKSLIRAMESFERIEQGFFKELFVDPIFHKRILSSFGLKKINSIVFGIEEIINGSKTIKILMRELKYLINEEKVYKTLLRAIRENSRWSRFDLSDTRERSSVLSRTGDLSGQTGKTDKDLIERVFLRAAQDYNLESVYYTEILPNMILSERWDQREEFLKTSEINPLRLEEVEKLYCKSNGLPENYIKDIARSPEKS